MARLIHLVFSLLKCFNLWRGTVLGRNKTGDLQGVGENLCRPIHYLDDKMEVEKYIFGKLVKTVKRILSVLTTSFYTHDFEIISMS